MKKLFGELKMSWFAVILFAIITGVYSGAVMLAPALDGTSLQDIGVSFEWWVIFAVIIVVNCQKWWEAMLKCFVFFLISQPLIYGVQIVFGSMTLQLALMYYKNWFIWTLLTIPGGAIAFLCKKQNFFGSLILGLGNTIQAMMFAYYLPSVIKNFPNHLITCIICVISIIAMSLTIQKEKKYKITAIAVPIVLTVAYLIISEVTGIALM